MDKLTQERRRTLVFRFAFISAALSLIVVLVAIGLEAYIRWSINRDFILIGGFKSEALAVSAFALMFGMAYLYRPERSN